MARKTACSTPQKSVNSSQNPLGPATVLGPVTCPGWFIRGGATTHRRFRAPFPPRLRLYYGSHGRRASDVGKGTGLTEKPDEDLVLAAIGGDLDSFVALCHRYYTSIVAIARAVLGDGHLAEDAAQEALAKACCRLDSLKNPKRFGAWLATICRNEARDILRRRPNVESLGERDVPAEMPDPDPEMDTVRRALDSMPPESRELLYLRYRNDLSYEAIADLLDISVGAVHGRLRRAKQEVKTHLERARDRRSS